MMEFIGELFVFVKVVEANSFSGAARILGTTSSSVSKRIFKLEEQLQVKLLNRTTRLVSLTEAGKKIYEHCVHIVEEGNTIKLMISGLQTKPSGLLRVTASNAFGNLHIAPLIPEFLSRNPDVTVAMGLNDRFVDLIEDGFDVAIRLTATQPDTQLIAKRIASFKYVLCCSPRYLSRHGPFSSPDDLVNHNCLRFGYMTSSTIWNFSKSNSEIISISVKGNFVVNSSESLVNAAINGVGVTLVPTFAANTALKTGQLVQVMNEYEAIGQFGTNIYAVFQSDKFMPPKVRSFIDFLFEKFSHSYF